MRHEGTPVGRHSERGATLVHIALAMVALMGFSAMVIDYGIFWAARRQAQNAADAGALAGAIALSFDDPDDFTPTGPAQQSAKIAAERNLVWGEQPVLVLGDDGSTPADVSFPDCPDGIEDKCVRVDVYRAQGDFGGATRTNPLPTFFARLLGIDTQNVMATATAKILSGTETECLRPWAVADKWDENVRETCQGNNCTYTPNDTWGLGETYDKWKKVGNEWVPNTDIPEEYGPDEYRPPGTNGEDDPGTGFGLYNEDGSIKDYGQLLQMKLGGGESQISPGWFLALDMSSLCTNEDCPENSGANMYEFAIQNCVGGTAGLGSTIPVENGNMTGMTSSGAYENKGQGLPALWERDPTARWDPEEKKIINSCAGDPDGCADGNMYETSPRVVPIPLFDIDAYLGAGYTGSNGEVNVTNVFGFFILSPEEAEDLGMDLGTGNANDTVYGVMVSAPGLTPATETAASPFLQTIVLVR